MKYRTIVEDKVFTIEIDEEGNIAVDGQPHIVDMRRIEPLPLYSLLIDNLSHEVFIEEQAARQHIVLEGRLYTVHVEEEHSRKPAPSRLAQVSTEGEIVIETPLPGIIVEVPVTVGQVVRAGETLVVLESMKMENRIPAPQDGTIKAVHVAAWDNVSQGQILLTLST